MPKIDVLRRKAEKARVRLGLTGEQVRTLQNCAWGVYEEVAFDLTPDIKKSRLCRRSTIIEVVVDANRLELAVRTRENLPKWPRRGEPDLAKYHPLVVACNDQAIVDLIGPAFSASLYEAGGDPDVY